MIEYTQLVRDNEGTGIRVGKTMLRAPVKESLALNMSLPTLYQVSITLQPALLVILSLFTSFTLEGDNYY